MSVEGDIGWAFEASPGSKANENIGVSVVAVTTQKAEAELMPLGCFPAKVVFIPHVISYRKWLR